MIACWFDPFVYDLGGKWKCIHQNRLTWWWDWLETLKSNSCNSKVILWLKVFWTKLQVNDHVRTSKSTHLQPQRKVLYWRRQGSRNRWEAYLRKHSLGKHSSCLFWLCLGSLYLHWKWYKSIDELKATYFKNWSFGLRNQLPFKGFVRFHVYFGICDCVPQWILCLVVFNVLLIRVTAFFNHSYFSKSESWYG